ncbi:hypothetical protein GCM10007385_40660 [Tateyamaria omphalii]|uniref:tetratricopeptide repeat protein n=1 Tax=Tateyamaria omphalii TaxID=299262 RepID=UPI00167499EB|nr:tetratricopeptide repeat protein [Tateyamaria omphalii]GGX67403.1 hypothetical protein GCM10007385_40660 [Tateyamaria omphalii]
MAITNAEADDATKALSAIENLIREGALDEADEAFASSEQGLEAHTRTPLVLVRLHMAQKRHQDALQVAEQKLVPKAANNPWYWAQCVDVIAAGKGLEDACAFCLDGLSAATAADPKAAMAAVDGLSQKLRTHSDRIDFYSNAIKQAPDVQFLRLRLANRYALAGKPHEAIELIQTAEALAPLPDYAERTRSMLYPLIATYSESYDKLKSTVDPVSSNSASLRRMARFATAAHRHDEAYDVLKTALSRTPDDWLVLYRLVRTRLTWAQRSDILGRLLDLRDQKGPDAAWDLQLGCFALQAGETSRGRELLASVDSESAVGRTAQALLGSINAIDDAHTLSSALHGNDEVVEVERDNAQGTVVVFANLTQGLELLPLGYLDSLFADLSLNAIYVRDHSGLMFQKGLVSTGSVVSAMHSDLAQRVARFEGPVMTLGNSFGANVAIRAALGMNVRRALSFSGIFNMAEARDDGGILQSHGAAELQAAGQFENLLISLKSRNDMRVLHVYGADFSPDHRRSMDIADLSCCQLATVPDVDHHYSAMEAIARGQFKDFVTRALAD